MCSFRSICPYQATKTLHTLHTPVLMAFLQLGGEGGGKPTFFEVYAADKLVPSLKAALIYSLSVSTTKLCSIRPPRRCIHVSSSKQHSAPLITLHTALAGCWPDPELGAAAAAVRG